MITFIISFHFQNNLNFQYSFYQSFLLLQKISTGFTHNICDQFHHQEFDLGQYIH